MVEKLGMIFWICSELLLWPR